MDKDIIKLKRGNDKIKWVSVFIYFFKKKLFINTSSIIKLIFVIF